MGARGMSEDRMPTTNIESPYGGGASSLPGATGSLLPVKFPSAPVLLADGPRWVLGGWQSCGSTRPLRRTLPDGSVPVLNRIGNGQLTYLKLLEMFVQWCRLSPGWCSEPCRPDGPVVAGGYLACVRCRLHTLRRPKSR